MKTDEIKRCIEAVRNGGVIVGADARTRDSFAAETELTAITERNTVLEADNAVKDGALRSIIEPDGSKEDMKTWCAEDAVLLDIPAEEVIQQLCEEMGRVRTEAQAALSPPTGKVLVDREKLKEFEWSGATGYCPVCRAYRTKGHEDDCWLAALLKEDHDDQACNPSDDG